jgi:short chain dehydrogenase
VNHECNATSGIQVAHHFIKLLVSQKKKGCVVFTSSIAASIPTPFAAMYASTKAFVSQLAASLHIECQPLGIDVCAIHPSPVASNFYAKLDHKVDMIEAAAKGAVSPDSLVDDIFRSIGACAWRDLGGATVLLRSYIRAAGPCFNVCRPAKLTPLSLAFYSRARGAQAWPWALGWAPSSCPSTCSPKCSRSRRPTCRTGRTTSSTANTALVPTWRPSKRSARDAGPYGYTDSTCCRQRITLCNLWFRGRYPRSLSRAIMSAILRFHSFSAARISAYLASLRASHLALSAPSPAQAGKPSPR